MADERSQQRPAGEREHGGSRNAACHDVAETVAAKVMGTPRPATSKSRLLDPDRGTTPASTDLGRDRERQAVPGHRQAVATASAGTSSHTRPGRRAVRPRRASLLRRRRPEPKGSNPRADDVGPASNPDPQSGREQLRDSEDGSRVGRREARLVVQEQHDEPHQCHLWNDIQPAHPAHAPEAAVAQRRPDVRRLELVFRPGSERRAPLRARRSAPRARGRVIPRVAHPERAAAPQR